jgi:hypothetical protein
VSVPPLPEVPCVRCSLDYINTDGYLAGSRFFLSYTGTSPSPGDCQSLAGLIASSWANAIAGGVSDSWTLQEVDVIDIASYTGSSGQAVVSNAGTQPGAAMPAQCAVNTEFGIARRYRGGKPRMFWPTPAADNAANAAQWLSTFPGGINSNCVNFFNQIAGTPIGNMGSLQHVNISFYQGFKNVTNTSGRTRAAPTYRSVALVDPVESYITKLEIGSQRRRRVATTY